MKEPKYFLCKKRKRIFLIEKTAKKISSRKKANKLKHEFFPINQKDTKKEELSENNMTLNIGDNNEKVKENQRHSLIEISKYVLNFIKQKKDTTGNDVTNEIKKKLQPQKEDESTQKNIQRRVYDAINVMGAIGLIKKNKQKISYINYPNENSNNVIVIRNDENGNDNYNDYYNYNEMNYDNEIDEERYNQKLKEELQIILIKKYLALDFYKVLKSLNGLREKENKYIQSLPIDSIKYDEQGRIIIENKEGFMNYLNHLRNIMGNSNSKHSSPYDSIKDFVKKDIISKMNDDNNKENDNINYFGDIPNNKTVSNLKNLNMESQPHNFISRNNNNEINNEKKGIYNLRNEEKQFNFIQNYKTKENDIENDDTFNYLKKTKKFIDEIFHADDLDYEINTIEIDIEKEEENINNRKISENYKSIKSYIDNNIKQDIDFMHNLNHFNFNS